MSLQVPIAPSAVARQLYVAWRATCAASRAPQRLIEMAWHVWVVEDGVLRFERPCSNLVLALRVAEYLDWEHGWPVRIVHSERGQYGYPLTIRQAREMSAGVELSPQDALGQSLSLYFAEEPANA